MRFFRMQSPNYHSITHEMQCNGNLDYRYQLPGLSCFSCGQSYAGSRILSLIAPNEIRNDKRFMSRWPVSNEEHMELQAILAKALTVELEPFVTFRPGDILQPAYLDLPSLVNFDFLWPNIRSFVISERIKTLIFDALTDVVDIVPVHLRKLGSRQIMPMPANDSTQPDQPFADDTEQTVPKFYQVLVRAESDYPKGGSPVSECPVCKHKLIEDQERELVMTEKLWGGQAIFFLKTSLHVVVTEALVEKIRAVQASNVEFIPY